METKLKLNLNKKSSRSTVVLSKVCLDQVCHHSPRILGGMSLIALPSPSTVTPKTRTGNSVQTWKTRTVTKTRLPDSRTSGSLRYLMGMEVNRYPSIVRRLCQSKLERRFRKILPICISLLSRLFLGSMSRLRCLTQIIVELRLVSRL